MITNRITGRALNLVCISHASHVRTFVFEVTLVGELIRLGCQDVFGPLEMSRNKARRDDQMITNGITGRALNLVCISHASYVKTFVFEVTLVGELLSSGCQRWPYESIQDLHPVQEQ